jgi:hypothetical protein
MYKIASQNQQRRADFIRPADLAGGEENQSIRDQRQNYKRAISDLIPRIRAAKSPKGVPRTEEYKALCQEQSRLIAELAALPHNEPMKADIGEILIDEMRKMLTKPQFEIAVKRARERYDASEVKDNLISSQKARP